MPARLHYRMAVALACILLAVPAGCARRSVTRVDTNSTIDLSGRWNDTDSRTVAQAMITDLETGPWLIDFVKAGGKNPTLITGSIRNKSLEHIAVGAFLGDIERELINGGRVTLVASPEERGEVRAEKADQMANAAPETIKKLGREMGADFMLIGEINQINDREGGDEVRYYQVDLTLVNIETNVKAWAGQQKIKKLIGAERYKP